MSIFPEHPIDAHHAQLTELQDRYPDWTIDPPGPQHVWTAELRTDGGRSVHFLAGHDLDELTARLVTATALDR